MLQLKDAGYAVTDAEDLKASANKATISKMAKALQVDAVLLGKISNGNDLTLSVYKADGQRIDQIKVKGGSSTKLDNAVQNEFDVLILGPVAKASGGKGVVEPESEPEPAPPEEEAEPPAEEPPPAEDTPPEEEAPKDDKPSKAGKAPLELDLVIRGYSRAWEYTDVKGVRDPSSHRTLRPYNLDFAPALKIGGIIYPAAFVTDGIISHFGIMGAFDLGIATSTDFEQAQADGTKLVHELKTSSQAWDVGVRGRIPIGPGEIALFVEYGAQSFILHGDEGGTDSLAPLVPDVKYTFVRLGVEPRVRVAKVLIGGHVAPRILTSLHNIDLENVWFPGASGWGLDFGLMVGYGVLPYLDVVLNADFIGYGFDFNPLPTDPVLAPVVAGGATDRYNSLSLGAKFTIPSH